MYVTTTPAVERLTDAHVSTAEEALDQLEDAILDGERGCECDGCAPYVFPNTAMQAARSALARLSDAYLTTL